MLIYIHIHIYKVIIRYINIYTTYITYNIYELPCLEYVSSETNNTHVNKIRFSSHLQIYYKSCFTNEKVPFYSKIPFLYYLKTA